MISIILAGGQSTRMGQDKGLMQLYGQTWAAIVRSKINSIPSFISIHAQQQKKYLDFFKPDELIIDHAELQIEGPLRGLLSAHLAHPDKDVLLIACDMIDMESIIIQRLIDEYQQQLSEAMAFKGERIEPLCAIYSARGLQKIVLQHQQRKLTKYSLMFVLEKLDTVYLPIKEEWKLAFKNFNSAEDLS